MAWRWPVGAGVGGPPAAQISDPMTGDPETSRPDPLLVALDDVRLALDHGGFAALPAVSHLPPLVVARALYRDGIAHGPWAPLVHLHHAHLRGGGVPAAALDQAAGGWLFIEGPDAEALARPLLKRATDRRISVLWQEQGPPRDLSPEAAAAALHADALHGVATDPALSGVRAALRAHCRAAGPVHITGEPGTGKVSLARWAHATMDDQPLSWLRAGQGQLHPGEWALIEEPAELHPDQRQELARLASASEPPEPVRRWSKGPARPRHPALRGILGHSPALSKVLHELLAVAPTDLPVLITGENLPLRKSRTPPAGPASRRGAACPSSSRSCRPRAGCVASRAAGSSGHRAR